LLLLFIIAMSGIGNRLYHFSIGCDFGPERVVIKVTLISLAGGVVDVLNVYEDGDGLQIALFNFSATCLF